jgi:uncharacterized protein (DUF1015 family)
MAIIKPFKGLRPPKQLADKVASRPYDVLNSEEARVEAAGNPYSLLRIIKPEIEFPSGTDEHLPEVYDKAVEMFHFFQDESWLVDDKKECLYIYAQTMNGRTQYLNNVIKKHELTRPDKEEDRMKHVRNTNANVEPVFFAYPAVEAIDEIVKKIVDTKAAEYDFVSSDGFGHHFWVINEDSTIQKLVDLFSKIPSTYVADGHHRTAAAALVGTEKRKQNPTYNGKEEFNYFLAVHFPDNQLQIIDYNRVVKDLNELSTAQLIEKLGEDFVVIKMGSVIYKPEQLHTFSMYLGGNWYKMVAKAGRYNDNDPIEVLDVTILSKLILDKVLGIKDLRTDKRIDFVGGIRGLGELCKRVDSGEMKVAFALFPVSMKQLINIADSGNIMPPKTTWFEPKLRSGLVIHKLE